jgi:hypothetical protein
VGNKVPYLHKTAILQITFLYAVMSCNSVNISQYLHLVTFPPLLMCPSHLVWHFVFSPNRCASEIYPLRATVSLVCFSTLPSITHWLTESLFLVSRLLENYYFKGFSQIPSRLSLFLLLHHGPSPHISFPIPFFP